MSVPQSLKHALRDVSRRRLNEQRQALHLAHKSVRKRGAPSRRSQARLERVAKKTQAPLDIARVIKRAQLPEALAQRPNDNTNDSTVP